MRGGAFGEPVAAELGLRTWPRDAATRQKWIDVMAAHPVLIQRPILLFDDGIAMVARDTAALETSLKEHS
jgi:arsenate reductase